ncbi:ABC transporter substrate-binding protein [Janibacter sp. GS2]|uniref:ABC transporter substrate-binding protein n=1 Tax=Janibacter sp. GS2 TaxID=3442646 RepID=UPI003EBE24FE
MRRAHVALFASIALGVSTLAGCGSDSLDGSSGGEEKDNGSETKVEVDDDVAKLVPKDLEGSTLNIGSDASYAPNEFLGDDGQTVEGMDVDLFDAAAAKMGLKTKWTNAPFDALILGVTSDKYDMAVSSFTINPERKKQVSMISYFDAGTQWVAPKGDQEPIDPDNACGKSIGVQKGTVQIDDLDARSKQCEKDGKQPIKQVVDQKQSKVTASLISGKTEAMLADSPIALYAVKQNDAELEALGDIYDSAPYGIVVPKDDTEFGEAIAAAFTSLEEDGTYEEILKKWGNESGATDKFAVNP